MKKGEGFCIRATEVWFENAMDTFHDHALHLYSGVLHTLPLVSGIHSLIQSPMIWTSLHQFLNPDLKHSSTEGPISNHSVTLIAHASRLIGRHRRVFNLFTYLLKSLTLISYVCRRREAIRDRKSMPLHDAGSQQRQPCWDVPHPTNLLHVSAVGSCRRRPCGRRADC